MGELWYTDANGKRKRTQAGIEHEYSRFQSSKKAKKDRAARNRNRRKAEREGKVHKGDGREIDHVDSNPRHNVSSNLKVVSRRTNRAKKENSRRRGSRRNRSGWGL